MLSKGLVKAAKQEVLKIARSHGYETGTPEYEQIRDEHMRFYELAETALRERERAFRRLHMDATDEELVGYVRAWTELLGRVPNSAELVGSTLILPRYKKWNNYIARAELPRPNPGPRYERRFILRREVRYARLMDEGRVEEAREQFNDPRLGDYAAWELALLDESNKEA